MAAAGCDPKATEFAVGCVDRRHLGDFAFSPDGKSLAVPKDDGRVVLCDLSTGKAEVLPSPYGSTKRAAELPVYSKRGQTLAVAYGGTGFAIWDVLVREVVAQLPLGPRTGMSRDQMTFTDGDHTFVALMTIAVGDDPIPKGWENKAVRWDAVKGERLSTADFPNGLDFDFKVISPDGRFAVYMEDDMYSVMDLATRARLFGLVDVGEFLFTADGSKLVTYIRGRITLREVPSGKVFKDFGGDYPNDNNSHSLSVSRDKPLLAVGRFNGINRCGIIDLGSGKVLDAFECGPRGTDCNRIRISPDGLTLATGSAPISEIDPSAVPVMKLWRLPASW